MKKEVPKKVALCYWLDTVPAFLKSYTACSAKNPYYYCVVLSL